MTSSLIRSRLANRVQLTTDGHLAYRGAVERAFGHDVDYAQLIKQCGVEESEDAFPTARRYLPNKVTGQEVRIVNGDPDPDRISTSYVERNNLSIRMSIRRFTRLTNGFSKKVENHAAAVALYTMWHNFGRTQKVLANPYPRTPAMAAGISDHTWTCEEIAAYWTSPLSCLGDPRPQRRSRRPLNIPPQTYAVLDIPEPAGGKIMDIRRRNRDDFRSALPPEVTLVGSSGVGCFRTDQEATEVFAALDAIAESTAPITSALSTVTRFPGTDIFVFQFTDESALRQLHQRIVDSGLRFEENRWPYGPHSTLRSRSPVTAQEVSAISAERIEESFVLDQLSVYHLEDDLCGTLPVLCHLMHRTRLSASAPHSN